jgi:hypothetical protein
MELVEKYKELKEKGQLEKFMQKKLKRKAQKTKKSLPFDRRSE